MQLCVMYVWCEFVGCVGTQLCAYSSVINVLAVLLSMYWQFCYQCIVLCIVSDPYACILQYRLSATSTLE